MVSSVAPTPLVLECSPSWEAFTSTHATLTSPGGVLPVLGPLGNQKSCACLGRAPLCKTT